MVNCVQNEVNNTTLINLSDNEISQFPFYASAFACSVTWLSMQTNFQSSDIGFTHVYELQVAISSFRLYSRFFP